MFGRTAFIIVLFAGCFVSLFAASIDFSFTTMEMSTPPSLIVIQADGKVLVAGITTVGGTPRRGLARLLPNGVLDTNFDVGRGFEISSPMTTNIVGLQALAVQQDGKILAAGPFMHFDGKPYSNLVRLNSDGSLDPTFRPPLATSTLVNSILVSSSGKILIAGAQPSMGSRRTSVLRLNSDGSIDPTFVDADIGLTGASARSLMFSPGEKPVFLGSYTNRSLEPTDGVFRLHVDGGLDDTFKVGEGSSARLGKLAVQADGGVLIVIPGTVTYDGIIVHSLVRLRSNGSVDTNYQVDSATEVSDVAPLPDGRVYAFGSFRNLLGTANTGLARLNTDGSRDASYETSLVTVYNGALQEGGKLLVSVWLTAQYPIIPGIVRITENPPPNPIIMQQPISQTFVTVEPVACGTLTDGNLPGATLTLSVKSGAEPFASSGVYQIGFAPAGHNYMIMPNPTVRSRSGQWSLTAQPGSPAIITLKDFLGTGLTAKMAVLADCSYNLSAKDVPENENGTLSISGGTIPATPPVTFTVKAASDKPLFYQWRFNGLKISGATNATLTLNYPLKANAGVYDVVVSNMNGSVTSEPAILTLAATESGEPIIFATAPGKLTLTWPTGYTLQASTSVQAGWNNVADTSPQTIKTTSGRIFYRLIKR
jgi:uncharacterized delta-60 repeat protein